VCSCGVEWLCGGCAQLYVGLHRVVRGLCGVVDASGCVASRLRMGVEAEWLLVVCGVVSSSVWDLICFEGGVVYVFDAHAVLRYHGSLPGATVFSTRQTSLRLPCSTDGVSPLAPQPWNEA